MDTVDRYFTFYLEKLRAGDSDRAFQSLIEAGPPIIPRLEQAFHKEHDSKVRAEMIRIAWNIRHHDAISLLARALSGNHPEVWKAALDGLVTLGTSDCVRAIEGAKDRQFEPAKDTAAFSKWLDEALQQINGQNRSPTGGGTG